MPGISEKYRNMCYGWGMRWLAVFLIFYSSSLRADCPSFKNYLSVEALQSLRQAQLITVKENLFKSLNGTHEYEVKILYSNQAHKLAVILGEMHVKTDIAAEAGKNIIKQFRLRGFEYLPPDEINQTSSSDQLRILAAMQISSLTFPQGSTIDEIFREGLTLVPDDWKFARKLSNATRDYQPWMYTDLDPLIEANPYVNIALETGCKIETSSILDLHYRLTHRNERMVDNIVDILSKTEQTPSLLVVVGKAHVPGMTDQLINQFGFEECAF
jgi:hypothetical protein